MSADERTPEQASLIRTLRLGLGLPVDAPVPPGRGEASALIFVLMAAAARP